MHVHDLWCKRLGAFPKNSCLTCFCLLLIEQCRTWERNTNFTLEAWNLILSDLIQSEDISFQRLARGRLVCSSPQWHHGPDNVFFSPSAAFSGDQCYYWVGSNYCIGFFFFFYLPWTEFQQKIDNACAAFMAKLDSRIITPAPEPAGREESAPPL